MGRKVFVSSDMSTDDRLIAVAEADPQAALLWPWVLTAFDDWGRAEASPRTLKARVFPAVACVTAEDVDRALRAFAAAGLLVLYESDGKPCMAIPQDKWFGYQTQIPKSKRDRDESRIPAPPTGTTLAHSRAIPSDPAEYRETSLDCAEPRASALIFSPSPSPSPSPFPPSAGVAVPAPLRVAEVQGADRTAGPEQDAGEAPPTMPPPPPAADDLSRLACSAYDRAKAVGWTPASGRWVSSCIGRMKGLTPPARLEVPEAVEWAARPGAPGHIRTWLGKCELVPLLEAWRERNTHPARASPNGRPHDPDAGWLDTDEARRELGLL